MLTQIHEEVFRQKMSALDKREVEIACDILVAMHPAQYFNALSRRYMDILRTTEEVGSIYKEKYHEYQRLIGNESQLVTLPKMMLPDSRDVEEDETLQSIMSLSDGIDEDIEEDGDIEDIDLDNLKVPNFLSN